MAKGRASQASRNRERRAPSRPRAGDRQPCPFCRAALMQFQERDADNDMRAGWYCVEPTCGYRIFVGSGATGSLEERHHELMERGAAANRRSMKARASAARLKQHSERLHARATRRKK